MKKLLTYLFLFASIAGFSQRNFDSTGCCFGYMGLYYITLDTTINSDFYIDTISNPDNIWRIAKPSKSVFDSAYSFPNVIITDTGTSYPVNNVSSFVYLHIPSVAPGPWAYSDINLSFQYWVDCHPGDSGMIEFSPDNGITWYDLINDSMVTANVSWENKPNLTGTSEGWQRTELDWLDLMDVFDIEKFVDTVQFRFTFISDSIPNTLDGFMFDHFIIHEGSEPRGVYEIGQSDITLFPNPSSNEWVVKGEGEIISITVLDARGRELQPGIDLMRNSATVDAHTLPKGMYFIYAQTEEGNYLLKAMKN